MWYDEEEEIGEDIEPDDLAIYYQDETYDVGEDSENEDEVWIWPTELDANIDADELEQSFAQFGAVQRAKRVVRRARGFVSPNLPGGFGK